MSDAYDLGRAGEEAAARYLTFHDYRLLDRNWRFEHAEIDLIAEAFGLLIIVEVKTRATAAYGDGPESVGKVWMPTSSGCWSVRPTPISGNTGCIFPCVST